ncbi:MAG: cyclic nucleotide-binding domain-containing protein [Polyangiaceae bacterium]|nr:cyclic nucleotide-binding domain-containing protein [Polyangiaceae bacterium]
MAETAIRTLDLFTLGKSAFEHFCRELLRYGIEVDPKMEVRRGRGILCFYNLDDGHIYLSLPDLTSPLGKLQTMVLASTLGLSGEDELLDLFELFIPHVVAHEMAHHLRHKHGLFGDNKWEEEQIANQLAVALTKRRLSPTEREHARKLLGRMLQTLSSRLNLKDAATVSYHSILMALNASGRLGDSATERAQVTQKLFSSEARGMMRAAGDLSSSMVRGFDIREQLIAEINEEYAEEFQKYVYYHAGWLHLDLASHGAEYVDDFRRERLGMTTPLLPAVAPVLAPTEASVIAYYRAFRESRAFSEAGSRYFYKRYRSMLWEKLRSAGLTIPSQAAILERERSFFLESWDDSDSDALRYVAHLAKEEIRGLFPAFVADKVDTIASVEEHLLADTDVRLYRHIVYNDVDEAAQATLYRLTLLDQTDVFRPVPAETVLELSRTFCKVLVDAGQTVIWEGEVNDDVFFLARGGLEVLVGQTRVGVIEPGEVFGEMAFFSRDIRNATVRARRASECFVVKDIDLLSLVFKHPSVLMQMAGVLTRRLADLNQRAVHAGNLLVPSVRGGPRSIPK